jgi:hypothetical protein
MSRIPKTKEQPTAYKTLFVTIMEPWETFNGKAMRQPNVQAKLLMKAKPLKVEPRGWGDNVIKVTL